MNDATAGSAVLTKPPTACRCRQIGGGNSEVLGGTARLDYDFGEGSILKATPSRRSPRWIAGR